MHASTHTLELDPKVTWRLVGVRKTARSHREARTPVAPIDITLAGESGTDGATSLQAPRAWSRPSFDDAVEFGGFAATLAAVALLQFGLFALLA